MKKAKRSRQRLGYRVRSCVERTPRYLNGHRTTAYPPEPVSRMMADAVLEDYQERCPNMARWFRVVRVMGYPRPGFKPR